MQVAVNSMFTASLRCLGSRSRGGLKQRARTYSLNALYKCVQKQIRHTMEPTEGLCTNSRPYGAGSVCKCPFSILTFNVYPGPVLPYTAPDLFPDRIQAQIHALRELNPDIMCLQELYCRESFLALRRAFPDYNVLCDPGMENCDEHGHPRRRSVNASWLGLIVTAVYVGVIWSFSWRPALLPFAAALALWCAAFLVLPRRSGLLAWLRNRGTGLAIMVRRSRAIVVDHCVQQFASQSGDPLNLIAKRGYSRTMIALESACKCGPGLAVVFNTHLNALGSAENRAKQARELALEIRRLKSAARIVVCGDFNEAPAWKSGVRECLEGDGPHDANLMIADPINGPTFCPRSNPLARGGWFTKSECLDHIYFKPGQEEGLVPTDQARLVFTKPQHLSDHYGLLAKFQ
jgi:endonuclease/exonuclease/phosphatase family metal-dependent hydrolase